VHKAKADCRGLPGIAFDLGTRSCLVPIPLGPDRHCLMPHATQLLPAKREQRHHPWYRFAPRGVARSVRAQASASRPERSSVLGPRRGRSQRESIRLRAPAETAVPSRMESSRTDATDRT